MDLKSISMTVVFLAAGCLVSLQAQHEVLTAGGNGTGTTGSISFSVGQVAYENFGGEGGSISLGVQQPHFTIIIGTDDPEITVSANVYPNPSNELVQLEFESQYTEAFKTGKLQYGLYDMEGKLLMKQEIVGPLTTVSIANLNSATYLLRITHDNTEIKTFKIFKTN